MQGFGLVSFMSDLRINVLEPEFRFDIGFLKRIKLPCVPACEMASWSINLETGLNKRSTVYICF
jgi:hypothetical protein